MDEQNGQKILALVDQALEIEDSDLLLDRIDSSYWLWCGGRGSSRERKGLKICLFAHPLSISPVVFNMEVCDYW